METYNKDLQIKTVRMDNSLIEQIQQLADENERDFSSQVRFMLKKYIELKKN